MALDSMGDGMGDAMESGTATWTTAPGVAATVTVVAPISIDPSSAALELTQGANTFGPYAATVSVDGSGIADLVVSFPALPPGLTADNIQVQPGTLIDGVFTPVGPPITDSSLAPGTPGITPGPDFALSAGPVQTNVADLNSCFLLAGADGDIHIKINGTYNADGTPPVDIPGMIAGGMPLSIALVGGYSVFDSLPAPAYQPADLLTVTAPPASAGTYARLSFSAATDNLPPPGAYYAWVQLGGIKEQAQDVLIVR